MMWKNTQNGAVNLQSLTENQGELKQMKLYTISQIIEQAEDNLLRGDEQNEKIIFNCLAHLIRVPEKIFYKGCTTENCKKKVNEDGDNYFCPNCGEVQSFTPRFLCKMKFCDYSGDIWINCIGDRDFLSIFEKNEKEVYAMQ